MAQTAFLIAYVGLAGALFSWVAGAVFFGRALRAAEGSEAGSWLTVIVWPFATARIRGRDEAIAVNKALVALLAFIMIAAAAGAVATNLQRILK